MSHLPEQSRGTPSEGRRVSLRTLRDLKAAGAKFAMLTAYDFPTARAAETAGVHALLVGDSMGTVLLGHENTRAVPLALMLTLGEAVRRGAPGVYLVGDMPFESLNAGPDVALDAARQFRELAGCDAVKLEVGEDDAHLVRRIAQAGIDTIAHLGLRPQSIATPDGYRAQARDERSIAALVADGRRMVDAGAAMLLLEAVPPEASAAVVSAVGVPVIGCGAGPACDGHVLVTQDMLGLGSIRPPRFVPVYADMGRTIEAAMRRWVEEIASGAYPAARHAYPMRSASTVLGSRP